MKNMFLFISIMLPLTTLAISEEEIAQIAHNQKEIYVDCNRSRHNIAQFISEISKLDNDKNSLLCQLHEHMQRGFSIGLQNEIMETLAYTGKMLESNRAPLSNEERAQFLLTLLAFINELLSGDLTITIESLLDNDRSHDNNITRACCNNSNNNITDNIIKVRDKLYVLNSAKFFKKAEFKDNVSIEGSLSSTDAIIGCDLTVGCNINMNDSINPTVGNILKNGISFIQTFGINNLAVGLGAGNFTTTGQALTAIGTLSLPLNTSGFYNTGLGGGTLMVNTIGAGNTAAGTASLLSNISGNFNTSVGFISLISNTSGTMNTAVGTQALSSNTTGNNNVAIGSESLSLNSTGSNNIAIGTQTGNFLASGDNNIYIANNGITTESGNIRIGTNGTHTDTYIQGIFGAAVAGGELPVEVDSLGKLGTTVSSNKFKRNIQDMNVDSENIHKLRAVTFEYNNDATHTKQYGLIAEEVAAIFPELIAHDKDGNPYSVRYQILPVLLLNEVQKQQAMINRLVERMDRFEQNTPAA